MKYLLGCTVILALVVPSLQFFGPPPDPGAGGGMMGGMLPMCEYFQFFFNTQLLLSLSVEKIDGHLLVERLQQTLSLCVSVCVSVCMSFCLYRF